MLLAVIDVPFVVAAIAFVFSRNIGAVTEPDVPCDLVSSRDARTG